MKNNDPKHKNEIEQDLSKWEGTGLEDEFKKEY